MSYEVTVELRSKLFAIRSMKKTVSFATVNDAMALVLDVLQAVELHAGRDPAEVQRTLEPLRASIGTREEEDEWTEQERSHDQEL